MIKAATAKFPINEPSIDADTTIRVSFNFKPPPKKYCIDVEREDIKTVKADDAEAAYGIKPISKRSGTIIGPPPIPNILASTPPIKAVMTDFLNSIRINFT